MRLEGVSIVKFKADNVRKTSSQPKCVNSQQSSTDVFTQDYCNIWNNFMGPHYTGYREVQYSL